jgi:trigger factor
LDLKNCEKKEKSTVSIIVGISEEEFQSSIDKAYIKNKNRISIPGFRKGKASRKIVEKLYGVKFFHSDALEILMPDVLDYAVKESKLKFIGQPQITNIDVSTEKNGVDITITASVYPEIKLGEYKGLAADKPVVEVLDSEIDNTIEEIRARNSRIEKVDRPAIDGDVVYIDYHGLIDGEPFEGGEAEDFELVIGSNSLIPGFEENLAGMSVGEERMLDLIFPDDYEERFAGKPVTFDIKLKEVKEKILPDLDDEFAKDISEFDTLEEYKSDLREKLKKVKQERSDVEFEYALLEKLADSSEVEIPDVMVEKQMDNAVGNFERHVSSYGYTLKEYMNIKHITPEALRESTRANSVEQVKIMLALDKIAELEEIEASPEDIENEYIKASEVSGMDIQKIKDTVAKEIIIDEAKRSLASKFIVDNAIETIPVSESKDIEPEDGEQIPERSDCVEKKKSTRKPAVKKQKGEEVS